LIETREGTEDKCICGPGLDKQATGWAKSAPAVLYARHFMAHTQRYIKSELLGDVKVLVHEEYNQLNLLVHAWSLHRVSYTATAVSDTQGEIHETDSDSNGQARVSMGVKIEGWNDGRSIKRRETIIPAEPH
jgi:hypothetical protein